MLGARSTYLVASCSSLIRLFKCAKSDSTGLSQGEYSALNSTLTFIRRAVSKTIEWWWILALSRSRTMFLPSRALSYLTPRTIYCRKFSNTAESTPPSTSWLATTLS